MKHAVAAAALVLLALPRLGEAQNLRIVDTTVLEYRGDNENAVTGDDNYGVAINKLYLNGQMDRTAVNAQVDAFLFSGYPDVPNPGPENPSAYASEARLERLSLVHNFGGSGKLTVGDAHQQLGRGLVLALRKVDELGTDQALRGGSVEWDADRFAALVFAGRTNVANMDGVTQKFIEDPNDTLAGASGTLRFGSADVSIHGLYLRPSTPKDPTFDDDQTLVGGAYLDLPATDWLSLYAEGAVEEVRTLGVARQGMAGYVAADLDLQVVQLLLEGLYLDQFQVWGSQNETLGQPFAYNQPPTLERIDQEVLDNRDVRGGRAKLSKAFFDGDLVLYVSGVMRRYGIAPSEVDALHGYGGFELTYGAGLSRWYLSGGWRQETLTIRAEEPMKTMAHAETDWVHAIGGGYAIHVVVNHEERELEGHAYRRGTTLLGLDRFGLGSLMAEIGYDDQHETSRNFYLAGIVGWEYDHWLHLRAVVGSQRGGIKCIGGICRDFPPFAGARFEASVQHDLL